MNLPNADEPDLLRGKKNACLKTRVSEDMKRWVQTVAAKDDLDESDIVRRALKFYQSHGLAAGV